MRKSDAATHAGCDSVGKTDEVFAKAEAHVRKDTT